MSKHILINDQTLNGRVLNQVMLSVEEDVITVRGLIKKRIEQEVQGFEAKDRNKQKSVFRRQNQNSGAAYAALSPFREEGFFILVNNKKVDDLNQKIQLRRNVDIRFVRNG